MARIWLLGALLTSAVIAQDTATGKPRSASTLEMMRSLDQLEPEGGWLAKPPGLTDEQWGFYRDRFGMAPDGNEPDEVRVGIGRMLFFDKRLSRDRTRSCASCHDPAHGFAEPRATSVGIDGQVVARNAPTLMNVGLLRSLFWDGRASTLEEQAAGPILHPAEMGMPDKAAVVARVRAVPEYAALFELAYGRAPVFADVTRALAAFQRTLVFVDAPFDDFRNGDEDAISADAKRGFELFAEHCRSCHPISLREPLLSDGNFHNVGVGFDGIDHQALGRKAFSKSGAADADAVGRYGKLGRALISKLDYQVCAFRTAPLRNVALTAPYMHDRSFDTLWQVVDHYNRGGTPNTWQDPQIIELGLDEREVDQIVAFLFTLTNRRPAAHNRHALARQRRLAGRSQPAARSATRYPAAAPRSERRFARCRRAASRRLGQRACSKPRCVRGYP